MGAPTIGLWFTPGQVGPAQVDLDLPVLAGTEVKVIADEKTKRVCRWLRWGPFRKNIVLNGWLT